ncbi:MAG: hypothetical protein ACK4WH_13795 [Phycisphaerales bacterium]
MNAPATTTQPRRVLRSVGAVMAGLVANIVLSGATDAALHATGIYPPMFRPMADQLWALALAYRVVFAVVGGFLTARIAPARPMRHVLVLLGIGAALGVLGALANWNKGPEFGPHWFSIGIVVTGAASTWLGGVLYADQRARMKP